MIPSWMHGRVDTEEAKPKSDPDFFDKQPGKFTSAVNREALTNAEKQAEAISRSDGFVFQTVNPWFKRTEKNINLVNKWLKVQGIDNPIYPEIAEAVDALGAVLDFDSKAKAPTAFKGPISGATY